MGIENVITALEEEIKKEQERILSEGKQEAEKIIAESKKIEDKLRAETDAELSSLYEAMRKEKITNANLEAKRLVNNALAKKVNELVDEAWEAFSEIRSNASEYQKILMAAIQEGEREFGSGTILCAKGEEAKVKKLAPRWQIETSDECRDGGIIVVSSDGAVRINATLRAIFEERFEKKIRWKAWKALQSAL